MLHPDQRDGVPDQESTTEEWKGTRREFLKAGGAWVAAQLLMACGDGANFDVVAEAQPPQPDPTAVLPEVKYTVETPVSKAEERLYTQEAKEDLLKSCKIVTFGLKFFDGDMEGLRAEMKAGDIDETQFLEINGLESFSQLRESERIIFRVGTFGLRAKDTYSSSQKGKFIRQLLAVFDDGRGEGWGLNETEVRIDDSSLLDYVTPIDLMTGSKMSREDIARAKSRALALWEGTRKVTHVSYRVGYVSAPDELVIGNEGPKEVVTVVKSVEVEAAVYEDGKIVLLKPNIEGGKRDYYTNEEIEGYAKIASVRAIETVEYVRAYASRKVS